MGSARIWLFGSATQVHNQSSIMDHLRTGSGTDEASASPARPSFTPILGRVNLLGQARRRPPRRAQNWLRTVVLSQRRRLSGCLPGHRDRWFRPVIGRRSVKYRVGGDGSRRQNPEDPVARRSDIRGKLPHRPMRIPAAVRFRQAAPITRSESRYRWCGRSGPKSPVRANYSLRR